MASTNLMIEVVSDPKPYPNGNPNPSDLVVDVCSAAAYGDLNKLCTVVERDGHSVANPDANGYYPLQWAALNNYPYVAQYIIGRGGDVNATDNTQQPALHWAAVRGSIAAADVLLQSGARVEAADLNGYRAAHVAAQYGQTLFLYHIIAKYGADFDSPDNDGRSPLHWASYKGSVDVVRLLLFKDAYQGRQDKEGCTPLHWAALRDNAEICTLQVHTGTKQELMEKDKSGFTPAQLASDKGHRNVAYLLSNASKRNGNFCEDKLCPSLAGKIGMIGYAPFLFFIVIKLMVLFINSVLAAPNFTKVTAAVGLWSVNTLSLAFGTLYMLYRCSSNFVNLNLRMRIISNDMQIARNITTNELANRVRYSYLRGPEGHFRNPYNQGFWKNCTDFCVQGYSNDDEISWPSLLPATL